MFLSDYSLCVLFYLNVQCMLILWYSLFSMITPHHTLISAVASKRACLEDVYLHIFAYIAYFMYLFTGLMKVPMTLRSISFFSIQIHQCTLLMCNTCRSEWTNSMLFPTEIIMLIFSQHAALYLYGSDMIFMKINTKSYHLYVLFLNYQHLVPDNTPSTLSQYTHYTHVHMQRHIHILKHVESHMLSTPKITHFRPKTTLAFIRLSTFIDICHARIGPCHFQNVENKHMITDFSHLKNAIYS